jgi:hypothetical protein
MAKLADDVHYSGTVGNVTFYQMWGKTYVRKKSSLTRKRVMKSKTFEKTRRYANDLGRAAQIGSIIYKALPADLKERWLYRAITGEAATLLYEGKAGQEVKDFLWKKYIQNTGVEEEAKAILPLADSHPRYRNLVESSIHSNRRLRDLFLERWERQGRDLYYFKQAWQNRGYFNRHRFREVLDQRNHLQPG